MCDQLDNAKINNILTLVIHLHDVTLTYSKIFNYNDYMSIAYKYYFFKNLHFSFINYINVVNPYFY